LAEGIRPPTSGDIDVLVSTRGRLDEYYIRGRVRIEVKLAE